jgi:dTDP-4-amino-4,6-dideoxygalactose transaminase
MPHEHQVPFIDMEQINGGPVRAALDDAYKRVLASSAFTGGPEVAAFEEALSGYVGAEYAVGVSSGTAALQLALEAAGIGRGDEVILPPNTFFATAEAIVATGATPVFADVDPATALIDPAAVRAALTERTAAVIPVHLYGQTVDMDAILSVTGPRALFVLEDACQAIGAAWNGRGAGSLGDAAAFSFYPGKNLGALGDAGALTTSRREIAIAAMLLRDHGQPAKYVHKVSGYNHRLDGLQAAFLAAKLPFLKGQQAARDCAAELYRKRLARLDGVQLLEVQPGARHVFHLMVVRVANRDQILTALRASGVMASIHYPTPIHLEPAWQARGGRAGLYPNAEALAASVLSLPIFPGMTCAQVERCVEALISAVGARQLEPVA